MKIVDLTEEYFPTFACCFEEWSEEMTNAGKHKRVWYDYMKDRGMRTKLAIDDEGINLESPTSYKDTVKMIRERVKKL